MASLFGLTDVAAYLRKYFVPMTLVKNGENRIFDRSV